MKYKNKIDLWIRLLLYIVMIMCLSLIFVVPDNERWIMVLMDVFLAFIFIPLFFGYTELLDEELVTRLGIFRYKVRYENIKSIRKCKNWLSSMAMTSDRIEIKEHKKGYILGTTHIGPMQKDEVFEELLRRCHNLKK